MLTPSMLTQASVDAFNKQPLLLLALQCIYSISWRAQAHNSNEQCCQFSWQLTYLPPSILEEVVIRNVTPQLLGSHQRIVEWRINLVKAVLCNLQQATIKLCVYCKYLRTRYYHPTNLAVLCRGMQWHKKMCYKIYGKCTIYGKCDLRKIAKKMRFTKKGFTENVHRLQIQEFVLSVCVLISLPLSSE